MMGARPIRLVMDPNATPIAHHTPVSLPVHWKEEVKVGLNQDVRLGVIEPVPLVGM